MRKFEKNTARKSLPSASQLPIIVPMKIWLRTEAERGGEQSARQHSSANPTSPKSPWSLQHPVSSDTSPAKDPADHRPTIYQAGSSHSPLATRHCSHISNRFWPANRSCRKQTIKPCLTGARTAQCRARFSTAKLQSRDRHPLSISHLLALTQGAPLAAVVSNREFLVLEIPQLIENKHRRPVLIENFEPNSAPSFRPFATAAFLPRGAKASRAASSLTEIPRNHFTAHGAV